MTNILSPSIRAVKARNILDNTIKLMVKDAEQILKQDNPNFAVTIVKCDWDPTRIAHRGGLYKGIPGINMAMYRLFGVATWVLNPDVPKEPFRVHEYPRLDTDPIIGGFYTDNVFDRARCYVAHEVAHALQFYHKKLNPKTYDRPHGLSFQHPYAVLRKAMVNPTLPNQKEMLAKYNEFINMVKKNETNLSS